MRFSKKVMELVKKVKELNDKISKHIYTVNDLPAIKRKLIQAKIDKWEQEMDQIIEGQLAELMYNECKEANPILIRRRTGEEIPFNEAFKSSYSSLTKLDKHNIANLLSENDGKYRIK